MSELVEEVIEFITRVSIREFDGGMRRMNAESVVLREIANEYGKEAARRCDEWRKANP
jgi:hypothetical protein